VAQEKQEGYGWDYGRKEAQKDAKKGQPSFKLQQNAQ
jgi:hypothetical protein